MKPSGPLKKQLHDALMAGFPSPGALSRFLSFHMEVPLSTIAGQGGLSDQVFDLIVWAEARGRLFELVEKAVLDNPDNADLRLVGQEFERLRLGLPPELYRRLVQIILSCFSSRTSLAMILAVAVDRRLDDISYSGALKTDVERVVTTAAREGWLAELYDQICTRKACSTGRPGASSRGRASVSSTTTRTELTEPLRRYSRLKRVSQPRRVLVRPSSSFSFACARRETCNACSVR